MINIGKYSIDFDTYNEICKEAYKVYKEITEDPTPIKAYHFQMGYVMRYLKEEKK